ncbi:ATPase domain-containing protein [Vulcanimicrobium alpinum]|uniref:ATPase domain-containing protein n=1 Tax=Vulcanimicrobium alpinum TaxID=3016050 RepID=UPI00295E4CE6|nr:ATPase domain-containing protein [Vulcanimicrobium alpinum]
MPYPVNTGRVSTGVEGLDEVLEGGLVPGRTYLISGLPGSGKTTIGWHYLVEGLKRGERVVYISFAEPEAELRANAERSGFDAAGVDVLDLSPSADVFANAEAYDIFSPREVESEPTTARILETVRRVKPRRVFVDSMTHLRHLTTDAYQFRRQVLALLRFLAENGASVVVTSESTREAPDDDLRFITDGVIELGFGKRNREIAVTKFRGSGFRGGMHALSLDRHGAKVFPRLIPETHRRAFEPHPLSSGIAEFDALLHGGIERGTVSLISGPTGVGKTTLGIQLVVEAARRGDSCVIYTFDERAETLIRRSEAVRIPVRAMIAAGKLRVVELEALRFGPDEFANIVRRDVEERDTRIVMIDSVSGYRISVSDDLSERIHALGRYLQNVGVTVLLIDELKDLLNFRVTDVGIRYLADNVIFLRYIERVSDGAVEIRRGIGVLKKRLSDFEKTVREFAITASGVRIGPPLQLKSIFSNIPLTDDEPLVLPS